MKALRLAVVLFASFACATLTAMVARAEAPKPTLMGAVPATFEYTHDAMDPDPKEATPSGGRVHFITPYYVGIGVASYKSALKDQGGYASILNGDLETTYRLVEITLNYAIGPVILGYGYGSGKVTYGPESMTVSGITFKRNESDVIERFLAIGIMVSPSWSIQAAWHALYAEVDQDFSVGGVAFGSKNGDLGALMTTVGVGYSF